MVKIKKIWFDGDYLYGEGDDGKTYRQSLLWYTRLKEASEQERSQYTLSTIGIHWRNLDEDVSFESLNMRTPSRVACNASSSPIKKSMWQSSLVGWV